jgi:hypothetical protein
MNELLKLTPTQNISATVNWRFHTFQANLLRRAVVYPEKRDIVPLIIKSVCEFSAVKQIITFPSTRIRELIQFRQEL